MKRNDERRWSRRENLRAAGPWAERQDSNLIFLLISVWTRQSEDLSGSTCEEAPDTYISSRPRVSIKRRLLVQPFKIVEIGQKTDSGENEYSSWFTTITQGGGGTETAR